MNRFFGLIGIAAIVAGCLKCFEDFGIGLGVIGLGVSLVVARLAGVK